MVKDRVMLHFDKIQHFTMMTVISALLGIVFGILVAVVGSSAISLGKEIYDNKVKKKDIELGDLGADGLGIILGAVLVFFIRILGLL